MSGKELITIVIPVYNVEADILNFCIESIQNQTYENIEIIIVDDGSSKECAMACDRYTGIPNIYIFHKENGGASTARNMGIEKAKGSFITFIDADDWVEPDYIEAMYNSFDPEADIVMCDRVMEYKNETKIKFFFEKKKDFSGLEIRSLIMFCIVEPVGGTWCKMYRAEFLNKYNLRYNVDLRRTQDVIFNLYAFYNAMKVIYIHNALYHYRMDNYSITKRYSKNADVILTKAANAFRGFCNEYFNDDDDIKQLEYYRNLNIISEILKIKYFNANNPNSYKKYKKELNNLINQDVYQEAIKGIKLNKINSDYVTNSRLDTILVSLRVFLLRKKKITLLRILMGTQKKIQDMRNYHS